MEQSLKTKISQILGPDLKNWITEIKTEYLEGSMRGKYYSLSYNPIGNFYTFLENYLLICAMAQPEEISEALECIAIGKKFPPSKRTKEMSYDIGIKLAYPDLL